MVSSEMPQLYGRGSPLGDTTAIFLHKEIVHRMSDTSKIFVQANNKKQQKCIPAAAWSLAVQGMHFLCRLLVGIVYADVMCHADKKLLQRLDSGKWKNGIRIEDVAGN